MILIEDRCCGCATEGYPCRGSRCPNRRVEVHYCDKCGDEISEVFEDDDGRELCEDCRDELYNNTEEE